jgi:endonuclease YncB( thermonuclease family)
MQGIEAMTAPAYRYRAELDRVIDGDTVSLNIDLGFGVWAHKVKVRLSGIDAPEIKEEGGGAARRYLVERLTGQVIVAETTKDRTDKYGRYLAELYAGHILARRRGHPDAAPHPDPQPRRKPDHR